jgi:hypothetical protein
VNAFAYKNSYSPPSFAKIQLIRPSLHFAHLRQVNLTHFIMVRTLFSAIALLPALALGHAAAPLTAAASSAAAAATTADFAADSAAATTAAASTGAFVAPADSTVISVYLDADQQPLVASVVSVAASTTAFHISCAPGTDSSDCGFGPGADLTIVNGNTYILSMSDGDAFQALEACTVSGTTAVECSSSLGGSEANTQAVSGLAAQGTTVYDTVTFLPLTVTAGADLLSSGAASAGAASSGAASSTTGTTKATTGGATKTATLTGATGPATGTSQNAAGRVGASIVGLLSVMIVMAAL